MWKNNFFLFNLFEEMTVRQPLKPYEIPLFLAFISVLFYCNLWLTSVLPGRFGYVLPGRLGHVSPGRLGPATHNRVGSATHNRVGSVMYCRADSVVCCRADSVVCCPADSVTYCRADSVIYCRADLVMTSLNWTVCWCVAETTSVHSMLTLATTSSSWQVSLSQRFVTSAESCYGSPVWSFICNQQN